jgi:putative transposase
MVLLPDHLHLMWTLLAGDADFSGRMAAIKASLTRGWLQTDGAESALSEARQRRRSRGVWQQRFWEHWFATRTILRP